MIDRRSLIGAAIGAIPVAAAAQGYVGGSLGPKHSPECAQPKECRIVGGLTTTTTLAYTPTVYDREGKVISPHIDGNKTTTAWQCIKCGKRWIE